MQRSARFVAGSKHETKAESQKARREFVIVEGGGPTEVDGPEAQDDARQQPAFSLHVGKSEGIEKGERSQKPGRSDREERHQEVRCGISFAQPEP